MMVVPQQSQSCNLHIPSPSHFQKTVRMSLVQEQKFSFRDLLTDNTSQQEIFRHVHKYGIPCKLTSPHKDSKKSFTSACDTCIQGDTFSEKTFKGNTPLPGRWNYSVWNMNNTGIWVPLHLLVNICAVNGAGTHLPIIFSLPQSAHKIWIKRSTSPSLKWSTTKTECRLWISFCPFWHFNATSHNRYNTESDESLAIPTRGRKVGLTGTIAVLEGRTRTG